jgi:hypothetical protein
MAWVNSNVKGSYENSNNSSERNTYGTRTPNLSDDWLASFKKAQGNLNAGGYTPDQQKAIDLGLGSLNTTRDSLAKANGDLGFFSSQIAPYAVAPDRLAIQGIAASPAEEYVGDVTAKTGADFMDRYKDPYQKDVIDASLADYDVGVDRGLSGLRASRDASGAFGDRAALADATYLGDSNRGRGLLVAGLNSQGFNTRAGYGMQDANRTLLADQGNQTTEQGVRSRNAGNLLDANKFNAAQFSDISKFNVDTQYKGDKQRMDAIKMQAGLSQQVLDNVFKGNQIDTDAAKSLFEAGQISQDQLLTLLQAASEGNGFSYTEDSKSKGSSNTAKVSFEAGIGGSG